MRLRIVLVGWFLATTCMTHSPSAEGASKDGGTPPRKAPSSCVLVRGEARYRAYGYDHVVVLDNTCPTPQRCVIWTNVNPKRVSTRLESGERQEILTFRGSPASKFSAHAECTAERS